MILCAWSALDWANVDFVDVLFTYDEDGFSFKGSWSYSR